MRPHGYGITRHLLREPDSSNTHGLPPSINLEMRGCTLTTRDIL